MGTLFTSCGSGKSKGRKNNSQQRGLEMDLTQFDDPEANLNLTQVEECDAFRKKLRDRDFGLAGLELAGLDLTEGFFHPDVDTSIYYYGYVFEDAEPIVFFNGGPSGNSHSSFDAFVGSDQFREMVRGGQSFVFMDQRGTGCSDAYPDLNLEFVSDEQAMENIAEFSKDISENWMSAAIVRDAEALRLKLFGAERKWKVYGQSYGALIAHRYLEIAPEGIASVHAHGFAITDSETLNRERHLAQKHALDQFTKGSPETLRNLKILKAWLGPDTCFVKNSERLCGERALDGMIMFFAFMPEWEDIREIINTKLVVDGEVQAEVVGRMVNFLNFVEDAESQSLAGGVISFKEISTEIDIDDPSGCGDAIRFAESKGLKNEDWFFAECRPGEHLYPDENAKTFLRLVMDNGHIQNVSLKTVKKHIDTFKIPFYLYSSEFDPLVPEGMFTGELKILGKSVKYEHLKNSAHDGFLTEDSVWKNLAR